MPATRSIATDAISPLIRARARGLSLTSTKCALPDSRSVARGLEQRAVVAAERRVELDRDDELALAQQPREPGLARRSPRAASASSRSPNTSGRRAAPGPSSIGGADRRDLRRCRAAAAADHPRAEAARLGGELGEVVRRRVREDDARAGEAREADVRERGEHEPVAAASPPARAARAAGPAPWFAPIAATPSAGEPLGRRLGR